MDISAISSNLSALPGALNLRALSSATPAAQRHAVAGQFEAIMLRQFLTDSVGKMMGGEDSAQGSVYGYMLTDSLAQTMAAGGGMGLSKIIEQQLTPCGQPAAPAVAAQGTP